MTNEYAINVLNSLKQYYNDKNEDSYVGFDDEDNEAFDTAIKSLEQTSWIPCSERLPKDGQKVLVTLQSDNIIDLDVDTVRYYHASAFWKHYVIAWMPLPESYRGESDE